MKIHKKYLKNAMINVNRRFGEIYPNTLENMLSLALDCCDYNDKALESEIIIQRIFDKEHMYLY